MPKEGPGLNPLRLQEGVRCELTPATLSGRQIICREGRGGGASIAARPHPEFRGRQVAAARLLDIDRGRSATTVKVNPDSPQRPAASRRRCARHHHFRKTDAQIGAASRRLDPRRIPPDRSKRPQACRAASLSRGGAPRGNAELDAIVCGSVAVTRDGRPASSDPIACACYRNRAQIKDTPRPEISTSSIGWGSSGLVAGSLSGNPDESRTDQPFVVGVAGRTSARWCRLNSLPSTSNIAWC